MKKYLHDRNITYYIENICHQFLDLYIIYIADYIQVKFQEKARRIIFFPFHSISFEDFLCINIMMLSVSL